MIKFKLKARSADGQSVGAKLLSNALTDVIVTKDGVATSPTYISGSRDTENFRGHTEHRAIDYDSLGTDSDEVNRILFLEAVNPWATNLACVREDADDFGPYSIARKASKIDTELLALWACRQYQLVASTDYGSPNVVQGSGYGVVTTGAGVAMVKRSSHGRDYTVYGQEWGGEANACSAQYDPDIPIMMSIGDEFSYSKTEYDEDDNPGKAVAAQDAYHLLPGQAKVPKFGTSQSAFHWKNSFLNKHHAYVRFTKKHTGSDTSVTDYIIGDSGWPRHKKYGFSRRKDSDRLEGSCVVGPCYAVNPHLSGKGSGTAGQTRWATLGGVAALEMLNVLFARLVGRMMVDWLEDGKGVYDVWTAKDATRRSFNYHYGTQGEGFCFKLELANGLTIAELTDKTKAYGAYGWTAKMVAPADHFYTSQFVGNPHSTIMDGNFHYGVADEWYAAALLGTDTTDATIAAKGHARSGPALKHPLFGSGRSLDWTIQMNINGMATFDNDVMTETEAQHPALALVGYMTGQPIMGNSFIVMYDTEREIENWYDYGPIDGECQGKFFVEASR